MKTFQITLLIAASFGTGFLVADGLAQASPELQFEPQTAVIAATGLPDAENCEGMSLTTSTVSSKTDIGFVAQDNQVDNRRSGTTNSHVKSENSDIVMSLDTYSAIAAAKQLPATELILQLDAADFEQMLELQQQDQEYSAQSELYQQQLIDFMSSYPSVVQPQNLSCGSKFCLLELELQDAAAWPALFKTMTAQQWWQSISYQSAAQNVDEQLFRVTLLLQQDWVSASDLQTVATADGEFGN